MICFKCGRRLSRAAAIVPAKPGVHPEGAVGPTCARKAGLLPPVRSSLFARKPRIRSKPATPQSDWVGA